MKFYILALIFIFSVQSFGQDIRTRLFKDVDLIKNEAENVNAALLSPDYYEEAMEFYKEAEDGLKDGDDLEDLRELVAKANDFFSRAIVYATKSAEICENALKARSDALSVGADTLSKKVWQLAESQLLVATREIEDDDTEDGEQYSFEAEKSFREAELEAIKIEYLKPTWDLLVEAEDLNVENFAKVSLDSSKKQIRFAERELEESRYDNDYARNLAASAYSEAKHAMNITALLKEFDEEDKTREELIHYYESPLIEIARKLDIKLSFEDGFTPMKNQIIDNINELFLIKDEHAELKAELARYKKQVQDIASEKAEMRDRLEAIDDFERRYDDLKGMFNKSEARVLRAEDKIIIRLNSIKFASGSSVLAPKYFSVLTKVQNSIKMFPGSNIVVEGHTDSDGKSDKNLTLSQRRADAVFQYLFANLDIDRDKIYAVGYGESKPVASNKSESGKSKNRRIDIIIKPR